MKARVTEVSGLAHAADARGAAAGSDSTDVRSRLMQGEVIVLRGCMQSLGLFESMQETSLEGIRRAAGDAVADRVAAEGFEALHRIVDAEQLPAVTEAVYEAVALAAPGWLDGILHGALGVTKPFYYERQPNVRFLLPYDVAMAHRAAYQRFAKSHGEGKITPHGPHRDSWLDCPTNAVNAWIAVGRVLHGNGLSIFPGVYDAELPHTAKGEITAEVSPGAPITFALAPGDALLFHGDQLHGTELNWTDETRHVVSFRLTLDKPHFRHLHYHHYAYSGFRNGPLSPFKGLPANLSWKWVDTRLRFLGRKLRGNGSTDNGKAAAASTQGRAEPAEVVLDASAIPEGVIVPVAARVCATRLADGTVAAFARRCPHEGADLTKGHVAEGKLVCPWHNLHFDLASGESPCSAVRGLRRYAVRTDGDQVVVSLLGGDAAS